MKPDPFTKILGDSKEGRSENHTWRNSAASKTLKNSISSESLALKVICLYLWGHLPKQCVEHEGKQK